MRCCVEDEGFVALRRRPAGGGVKPPRAALVEVRRGERRGKGEARLHQVLIVETSASEPLIVLEPLKVGMMSEQRPDCYAI